jgi:hypothetical protein
MWTPKEVRKTIVLISGIAFVFFGIYLMVHQVNTTGTIDINSTFLTGKIQSGSAGLFVAFFGLILSLSSMVTVDKSNFPKLKNNKIILALLLLVLISGLVYFMINYPKFTGIGLLIAGLLIILAFIVIAIVIEEDEEQKARNKVK